MRNGASDRDSYMLDDGDVVVLATAKQTDTWQTALRSAKKNQVNVGQIRMASKKACVVLSEDPCSGMRHMNESEPCACRGFGRAARRRVVRKVQRWMSDAT